MDLELETDQTRAYLMGLVRRGPAPLPQSGQPHDAWHKEGPGGRKDAGQRHHP